MHLKYLFKRTIDKKIVKGTDIGPKAMIPSWLKNGLIFIYTYDKKYKISIEKTIFHVWQTKSGRFYVDVDNVYPSEGIDNDMRIDDVLPLDSNIPMDFFIRPNPQLLDPWHVLKKEGFENLGKEIIKVPLGVFLANAFYKSAPEDCKCKTQDRRAGVCSSCNGTGKDGIFECKTCSGTGKCLECDGRGAVEYQTKIWYEPVTGIKLKTERKLGNVTLMLECLERIEPKNFLEKLSHVD